MSNYLFMSGVFNLQSSSVEACSLIRLILLTILETPFTMIIVACNTDDNCSL